MRKDRLKKVIEAVEKTPQRHFYMGVWARKSGCKTVGCAVGSFCLRNPRAALKLAWQDDGMGVPKLRGFSLTGSIEKYFDISFDDMEQLFCPGSYIHPSKANVLKRLREFIKPKKKVA